jgi:hypothetical protein
MGVGNSPDLQNFLLIPASTGKRLVVMIVYSVVAKVMDVEWCACSLKYSLLPQIRRARTPRPQKCSGVIDCCRIGQLQCGE